MGRARLRHKRGGVWQLPGRQDGSQERERPAAQVTVKAEGVSEWQAGQCLSVIWTEMFVAY